MTASMAGLRGEEPLVATDRQLAAQGSVVSYTNPENPASDLFHGLRAKQPFIFCESNQQDRVLSAAVKAAGQFRDAGPLRLITWSSANGWQESSTTTPTSTRV